MFINTHDGSVNAPHTVSVPQPKEWLGTPTVEGLIIYSTFSMKGGYNFSRLDKWMTKGRYGLHMPSYFWILCLRSTLSATNMILSSFLVAAEAHRAHGERWRDSSVSCGWERKLPLLECRGRACLTRSKRSLGHCSWPTAWPLHRLQAHQPPAGLGVAFLTIFSACL